MIIKSGIYILKNIKNEKKYIGSTTSLTRRKSNHFGSLKMGKHHNSHLQNSWNKYGENSFVFEILEYCENEQLLEREQYWIDYYKSYDKRFGYNALPIAGRTLGFKHSEETKIKMRIIMKGKYDGEKHPHFGKALSEETKRKISESKKNLGDEFRDKMSEIQKGENNSCAILNWDDVRKIRKLWETKKYTQTQLAGMFGVSRGAINNVVNNYQWKEEKK